MARWTSFEQDPDVDEFGVGTFTDPNGNSIYGIDPELATRLAQIKDVTTDAPDQRLALAGGLELLPGALRGAGQAMTQPLPWVQKANEEKMRSDAVPQMSMPEQSSSASTGGMSMPEDNEDQLQSIEPPPQERTEEPQPDMADDELMPIEGLEKTSPEFRTKLVEMAKAKGLDPNAIAAVIATESGFKAHAINPNQANAGLLQFSKKYWPAFAANAGTPDVTWEEMRKMTAEEQLPYVISYFEHANLPANATPRDYKMATFYPAGMGKDDDYVLFEKDNDAKVEGGFRSSVGYAQNAGLDKNKDGQITVGEVSGTLGRVANRVGRTLGGGAASAPQQPMQGMVSAGDDSGGGQGPLINPYDQQVLDIANQQNQAIGSIEQQAQEETARRAEFFKKQQEALAQQRAEKEGRVRSEQEALKLADDKLRTAFDEPVQKLDPDQYFKKMSTGDRVMSVISVIAGAIGQAFLNAAGIKAGNSGLELLNRELENSIMRQKEEILAGRADRNNRIEHYRQQGFNAQAALKLASAELDTVTSNQLKSEASKLDGDQETQRWMLQESTRLRDRGQQLADQVRKDEHANQVLRLESARTAAQLNSQAIDDQLKLQKLNPPQSPVYRPGDEDTSDEARQLLAKQFDTKQDAKAYKDYGYGMQKAKELEDVTNRLQKLVGLERGTDGKLLPAKDGIPGVGIFDFKRELGEVKAREIKNTLTQFRTQFRAAALKTEPPPAVEKTINEMLDAKFEGDMVPLLERMWSYSQDTRNEANAQTLPRVRARWKSDNGYPLQSNTNAPGIRRK